MQGLPVDLLVDLSELVKTDLGESLDVVLSYSHVTLQNMSLLPALPRFYRAGVQKVLTASPLSMGLLRSAGPQPWHPASKSLRDAVKRASDYLESSGDNLADAAVRYVFANWHGCVIGGWSNIQELEGAVKMWHSVKAGQGRERDDMLWAKARQIMGTQIDTMWSSPEKGWVFNDGTKVD
jgi:D-arabinose 1-dehydrogenase